MARNALYNSTARYHAGPISLNHLGPKIMSAPRRLVKSETLDVLSSIASASTRRASSEKVNKVSGVLSYAIPPYPLIRNNMNGAQYPLYNH
jgi:hypothetical protein